MIYKDKTALCSNLEHQAVLINLFSFCYPTQSIVAMKFEKDASNSNN